MPGVGFLNLSSNEQTVLSAFRHGELVLPYKALEGFLLRQETYKALSSLIRCGLITPGLPYKLTRSGRKQLELISNATSRFDPE